MVCKKEVCEWFHNLDAPSRIEIVCEVLKMCLPLELRLFGSCLEDLARKDFLPLKEFELKANAFKGLENVEELALAETRSLLITYVCLVHPSNKQCAGTLFNMLSSLVPKLEKLQSSVSLEEYLEDALLLMTIAVHHPAFSFEQKQKLIEHLKTVKSMCVSKQNGFGSQYTSSAAAASIDSFVKPETIPRSKSFVGPDSTTKRDMRMTGYSYPTAISIVGVNCRGPANLTIEVTWSNLQKSVVNKTMDDLSSFQLQLTGWCSSINLSGASYEKSKVRMQTHLLGACNAIRRGMLHPSSVKKLSLYFSELLKAHDAIPKCDIVRQFFSSSSTHAAFSVPEERGVSAQSVHHAENVVDIGSSTSPALERTRTNSKRLATQDSLLCSTSDATDPAFAAWSERQQARSPGSQLAVGYESPAATGRLCAAAAADSGGDTKVHHRWPEQLLHFLSELRLQKHCEKLQSMPFENFLRMTESELTQCGLPEGAARKLVVGRDKFMSNGFARPSSGTTFPAAADESSCRSEAQAAASSKMHLKSEGTAVPRTGSTASARITSFDEPQGFRSEQAAGRRPSSQTVRIAVNAVADQSNIPTEFTSKHGSQDNLHVHRSSPAINLSAKERPVPRTYSPATADSGQQSRRPAVKAGLEASTDHAHILGSGHHQYPPRPGTVHQAAAAAAASCASGIQPVAGSMLREASGGHTRKTSTEASSSAVVPTSNCPDSLYQGPRSTPPVSDEPVTFISPGTAQMQPPSSCSSPEASSASDGSEADPNTFSSQQAMPMHPSYAPYIACRYPDCYGQFPLALATAPSASQISPSSHIPTTFGRPVGTASYSQRPYVPPHGGRYATLPFAHGLHGLPGSILFPQNGVPGVPGSGSAGDLVFSSQPGPYISVDSQGMPATPIYHRPLLSPHASRGCQPGHLSSAYPSNQGSRKGCYNCGQMGHKASDCREPFLESMLAGQYRLKYESQLDAE